MNARRGHTWRRDEASQRHRTTEYPFFYVCKRCGARMQYVHEGRWKTLYLPSAYHLAPDDDWTFMRPNCRPTTPRSY